MSNERLDLVLPLARVLDEWGHAHGYMGDCYGSDDASQRVRPFDAEELIRRLAIEGIEVHVRDKAAA